MADSNPNGANQYQLDPRQKFCWESYIDPKSATFGNGTQSAIRAGYEPDYADRITTVDWFVGKVRKLNILNKAEKNLENLLGSDDERIQSDMTKFALKTLGKKDYSERTELTGADGESLNISLVKYGEHNTATPL